MDLVQLRTGAVGHVAAEVGQADRAAERHRGGLDAAVDHGAGPGDRLGRLGAHLQFELGAGGHHVHGRAAVGNDPVDPDAVLVVEGVALGVDHVQRLTRHRGRVDPVPRTQSAVRRLPFENDLLHAEPVETFGREGVMPGMDQEDGVDIVEQSQPDEFGLAAAAGDLFLGDELAAVVEALEFLRGHGDEGERAGKFPDDRDQRRGGGKHHRKLCVMSAGVGRAGDGVGKGMRRHGERVELAHNGDPRAGPSAVDVGPESGDGQPRFRGQAEFQKFVFHDFGGLEFLVAGFRRMQQGVRQFQDLRPAAVDLRDDGLFQFGGAFHAENSSCLYLASTAGSGSTSRPGLPRRV